LQAESRDAVAYAIWGRLAAWEVEWHGAITINASVAGKTTLWIKPFVGEIENFMVSKSGRVKGVFSNAVNECF